MGSQVLPGPSISFTRYKTYDECPRRWLYQYRSSLLPGAPVWPVEQQRKLAPWQTFAGKVVDAAIGEILHRYKREGKWPEDARKIAQDLGSRGWAFSKEWVQKVKQHASWPKSEHGFQPLDRHYYHEPFTEDERQAIRERVVRCAENFIQSGIPGFISGFDPECWRGPRLPSEPIPQFDLDGVTVWAAPDFALVTPEITYLIDWKTGALHGTSYHSAMTQLHWYALFATRALGVAPESIRLMPVWLYPEVEVEEMPVRVQDLEDLQEQILDRYRLLCDLLPGVERLAADLEDWPHTSRASLCKGCVFRQSCGGATRTALQGSAEPDEEDEEVLAAEAAGSG